MVRPANRISNIPKLTEAVRRAEHVYLCGNGGSAANATHIANDLIAAGIKAHSLTADIATLTAIANDFEYANVFSNQLVVLGTPKDLLIVLSGSGRSANILRALIAAKTLKMITAAIYGYYNRSAAEPDSWRSVDIQVWLGRNMQEAEEAQLWVGHELMRRLHAPK